MAKEVSSNKSGGMKRPLINRNASLKRNLRNSLLNYNSEWVDTISHKNQATKYNFIDLFAGAGGISCGFEMAGLNGLLGVEIDPIASETYMRNFPQSKQYCGDIRKLSSFDIKKIVGEKTVHIIAGGFPCQGFSLAGFRDPDDARNTLYKEIVRIVKDIKPWFVILENVPGVATMKDGQVYRTIINDFASIGYPNMSLQILESADYGIPQLRPRAVFIANRLGLKNPYPSPQLSPENYVPIEEAIDDLKDKAPDASINHEWTRHSKKMEERISKIKPGHSLYENFYDAYKRQYKGIPCMTIKENHGGTHVHPDLNRCISAREMARLQSFPDSFIFAGTMKKAMWQIGNAVPPILFKNIALALIPKLKQAERMVNLGRKAESIRLVSSSTH